MLKRIFFLVLSGLAVNACLDQPDCVRLNNNRAGIAYKYLTDGSNASLQFDSIWAVGSADTIYDQRLSAFVIRLNHFAEQTTVKFADDEATDSIVFEYSSQVQFVSEDCGERYVLSNLRVVKHTFDSLRIVGDTPAKDNNARNIEIYF